MRKYANTLCKSQRRERINNDERPFICALSPTLFMADTCPSLKAAELGDLTVGVLTDDVITSSFRRFPLLRFEERVKVLDNIKGVKRVIPQRH